MKSCSNCNQKLPANLFAKKSSTCLICLDQNNLESLEEYIHTVLENKIYMCEDINVKNKTAVSFSNIKDYINIASKYADMIYYKTDILDSDETPLATYIGKIYEITMMYILNDIIHVYNKEASWWSEYNNEQTDEEEDNNELIKVLEQLQNNKTSIIEDYITKYKLDTKSEYTIRKNLSVILKFDLQSRYNYVNSESELINKEVKILIEKILEKTNIYYKEVVDEHKEKCAKTFHNKKYKQLTKSAVELYLHDNKISLPKEYVSNFWQESKVEFQRLKTT